MAPTAAAVSFPLVLRASFLFSGMFGIRLEGLKDENGQPITVQSAMPLNFTVPAVLMNQTYVKIDHHFPDRTDKTRCIDKCKPNNNANHPLITPFSDSIKVNKNISSSENGNNGIAISLPPLYVQLPAATTTTRKPLLGKPCGPGRCSYDEICVSWMKENISEGQYRQRNLLVSRRESPMMVHECLPNDGIHWTKMNPTGAKLCGKGKTHSILLKQSQLNCASKLEKDKMESCAVVWSYNCVDEKGKCINIVGPTKANIVNI